MYYCFGPLILRVIINAFFIHSYYRTSMMEGSGSLEQQLEAIKVKI